VNALNRGKQVIEKALLPSLRAKRSNLVFKEINKFEIASSHKTLLAMTIRDCFNKLTGYLAI